MPATITIPDDLYTQVKNQTRDQSVADFVQKALRESLEQLRKEELAREMEAGYQAEAENPSLDPAWSQIETEGW